MDKKMLDSKSSNKRKPSQYFDLKGYYERKKRDEEVNHEGDAKPFFQSEIKHRPAEHSKVEKPPATKEKVYKLDFNPADKDLSKRFIEYKLNRNSSNTRTNLKNQSNTRTNYSTSKLNRLEETPKKESGLQSIINIVNTMQNVLANKSIEFNVNKENVEEKPKRKRSLRAKKSEIETAVANIKVSEVQIADSLVNRFKENCFSQQNNNDAEIKRGNGINFESKVTRIAELPQTNVLSFSSIQKKYDITNKFSNQAIFEKEINLRKPAVVVNSKLKTRYTPLNAETVPCQRSRCKSNRYSKQDRFSKGVSAENSSTGRVSKVSINTSSDTVKPKSANKNNQKKKLIIRTVCLDTGDPKCYKAVAFEEHKNNPTQLQIKIPNGSQSKTVPTRDLELDRSKMVTNLNKGAKYYSVKPVSKRKKDVKKVANVNRPIGDLSAPTEVAKWALSSVDPHSQPYYEAWVDTTLTAISNSSEDDYKRQVIKSFMQLLEERPLTPALAYENLSDEKYTGKIKIRTKGVGVK